MTKRFGGFLVATDPAIPVPLAFFTDVLPQISDLAEIHVSLAVFRLAALAGGMDAAVYERAILRDRPLRDALRVVGSPREPDQRIGTGLDLAVGRGVLIRFVAAYGKEARVWYYVNTAANQALIAAMERGAIAPPEAIWEGESAPTVRAERPNVFRLYEQNIGLLTPLIADHLVDALETYPRDWIEDAIAEAVSYNRRSWRYVQRILEKWSVAGRGDSADKDGGHETHRRSDARAELDPERYKAGRHLAQKGRP